MTFEIPLKLSGSLNSREHWRRRAKRVKAERNIVAAYSPLPHVWRALAAEAERFTITLTRIAPRTLDDDNLVGRMKATRDEVARLLGIDDGSPRLTWLYRQTKGEAHQHAVTVHVWPEALRAVVP